MNTSIVKRLKNTFGYGTSTSVSLNNHTHTPSITISSPINTALSGMVCISGCSSSVSNGYYNHLNGGSITISPNSFSGLQAGTGGFYNWGSSAASSIYYTPEQIRKDRIQQLKTELDNDPELLNDILVDLRKDKIERIKSKGGF